MIAARRPEPVEAPVDDGWDPPQQSADRIDVQRYVDALRRRWWVILATTALSLSVAVVWTLRQPKLYRATASIVIETRTPRLLTGVEDIVEEGSSWVPTNFFETEYAVMRSRAVARVAADNLGLLNNDKYNGLAGVTDPDERAKRLAEIDPADFTLGRYTVEPDRKSNIVNINVVDPDRQFAADLANAAVDAYRDHNRDKKVGGTKDASRWLGVQHDELRKKLDISEQALIDFMDQNDVLNASLESQLEEVKQRLSAFNGQLATEEASSIRDALNVEALKQVKDNPALIDTLPEIQSASVVNALKTRLIELRAMQTELTARYQADHPKMKLVNEQIGAIATDLKKEIDNVITALSRQKASRDESIRGLKVALDVERLKEARLNKLALDYNRLKRERDTNIQLFEMVTSRMKEADITAALPFNNVRLLDEALAPKAPFKPDPLLNGLVGLALGLLIGIALLLMLELLDNTVKSQEDVEQMKLPFLGLLPIIESDSVDKRDDLAHVRERDLHVLRAPRSAVAECARFIRTNLLFMSPDRALKMLVVTSPGPKEGKTTTAVNVAITMAQAGSRTLLVDTDLRRPRIHRVFGLSSERGLTTVLVGDCTLAQAIHGTEVPGLDVLVCGPPPPNPAEILLSHRFKELVDELGKKYDRVIFDTSPIGPVTDPAILGGLVDGVVVVVKCGKTRKDASRQSLRALNDAGAHVFGAILNDVDVTSKRYSGVYYSYYRNADGDPTGADA